MTTTFSRRALLAAVLSSVSGIVEAQPTAPLTPFMDLRSTKTAPKGPRLGCDTSALDSYLKNQYPKLVVEAASALALMRGLELIRSELEMARFKPTKEWEKKALVAIAQKQSELRTQLTATFKAPESFLKWGDMENGVRLFYPPTPETPIEKKSYCLFTDEYYNLWLTPESQKVWAAERELLKMTPAVTLRGMMAFQNNEVPGAYAESKIPTTPAPIILTSANVERLMGATALGLGLALDAREFWTHQLEIPAHRVMDTIHPEGESAAADHVRRVIQDSAIVLDKIDFKMERSFDWGVELIELQVPNFGAEVLGLQKSTQPTN